jgi:putative colanic acid biosynthesis acetyltransferase WcaF
MAKDVHYNAADHIPAETATDPYLRPASRAGDRARRLVLNTCRALLYRPSPRSMRGTTPECDQGGCGSL